MSSLRNPSPVMLGIVTVAIVIPLFWPVTLYVWLRFLTGHRSSTAAPEAIPPGWGDQQSGARGWQNR